jgi:hypothetical protein
VSAAQPVSIIEARVVHKKSNALKLTFTDGPREPFAVAEQGAGDGRAKKLGTLFGFNNGGPGHHRMTERDGTILDVISRDAKPSTFSTAAGDIATIDRAATSVAVAPGGQQILRFVAHPEAAKSAELFRLLVLQPDGAQVASIDVIRKDIGWTLGRIEDALWKEYVWWDRAGRSLPIPILGVRLVLDRDVSELERAVLLGACTDIAIGLRPYIAEMA